MVLGFNFELLLTMFLIPMLYALIIYFTSPYKSVSFKRGLFFLWGGITSIIIVKLIYFFIPSFTLMFDPFIKFFGIVGPVEEISKLIMFYMVLNITKDKKVSSHPSRFMFYFAMVGLGFAIIENVQYVKMYGSQVLTNRLFTSTIAHMIFGLFLGYWVGLTTIKKKKFEDRSIFGVLLNKYKKLKMCTLVLCGLFVSSFYHGIYNYNLATSNESTRVILIIILSFGVFFSKTLLSDLNYKWKNRDL